MNAHISATGGQVPPIDDVHVILLYDPESGRVIHLHKVTVFKGGQGKSEQEAIEAALAQAAKVGHSIERLNVKVWKNPAYAHAPQRVDLSTGDVIAPPAVSRSRHLAGAS